VIKRDSENFEYIDVGREQFDGKEFSDLAGQLNEKLGKCPRCGDCTVLLKSEYKNDKCPVIIDICPHGHGVWLDGGEILQLRKRGLVNACDKAEFYMDFIGYIFSKDGFNDAVRGTARIIRNLIEKLKYNDGLTKETAMEKEE
jgi:Zn-finger nucleic acid-binding protein